jgi:hypothetical protein
MRRRPQRYFLLVAVCALLVGGVVGGVTRMAGAQSDSSTPSVDPLQQQAIDNAQSGSSDSSEGVLLSDCPGAVATLEAAGMAAPSPDDHISPDCSAASDLARAYAAANPSAAK